MTPPCDARDWKSVAAARIDVVSNRKVADMIVRRHAAAATEEEFFCGVSAKRLAQTRSDFGTSYSYLADCLSTQSGLTVAGYFLERNQLCSHFRDVPDALAVVSWFHCLTLH